MSAFRTFRASWKLNNLAALKTLDRLKAFSRFAFDVGWIADNYVKKLKNPKITDPPTLPFSAEQVSKVLLTCNEYPDKVNRVRLRALVLLLRYSGLRIRDAVTLQRNRIQAEELSATSPEKPSGKLFLYTARTGTPVFCPLPPAVVQALDAITSGGQYFLLDRGVKAEKRGRRLAAHLRRMFKLTGITGGHAHRFRDTFAVELLLCWCAHRARFDSTRTPVPVRITEKHYAPWVRARAGAARGRFRRDMG